MPQQQVTYRIKNERTGQWCSAGYGSWVTQTMSAKTTEMVKA